MQVMILYLIVTAMLEMVLMNDPEIVNYSKPLSVEDKENLAPIRFKEYDYILAVKIDVWDFIDAKYSGSTIPEAVGSFKPWIKNADDTWELLEMKDCAELLPQETIDASSQGDSIFGQDGQTYCIDPELAKTGEYYDELGNTGD